ncbi:GNAT family N-acetyltransferase [Achromobacter marplatensis]|uniref:GNAT family N-acetyltransferase n=1 Tax=Achromobacter marplatensis TaxID=470868 RepID=UPI0039F72737
MDAPIDGPLAHAVRIAGRDWRIENHAGALAVTGPDGRIHSRWDLRAGADMPALRWRDGQAIADDGWAVLAAAFAFHPRNDRLALEAPAAWSESLAARGAAVAEDGRVAVLRTGLLQQPEPWLAQPHPPYAQRWTMSHGRRHPARPKRPQGEVYARHIPWLGKTLSLTAFDLKADLPALHRWMNDPVVAHFWQEEGSLDKQRAYIEGLLADPRVDPLILRLDGRAFGYVETYWAKEDRIAPYYDARDYDRGWHVLIGEADCRGRPFVTAWQPSVAHYLFLDDPRTTRLVIEPRADNHKMRRNLLKGGYAILKEFDFPHKRAALGMLLRERFFDDAAWLRAPEAPASSAS